MRGVGVVPWDMKARSDMRSFLHAACDLVPDVDVETKPEVDSLSASTSQAPAQDSKSAASPTAPTFLSSGTLPARNLYPSA